MHACVFHVFADGVQKEVAVLSNTVEIDFLGDNTWSPYATFSVPAGQTFTHLFPTGYSAHWVRVKSGAATTATAQFTYGPVPGDFASWQSLHWPGVTDPAIIGPLADPDFDGEVNLLEFATAQNPTAATRAIPSLVKSGAALEFTYTRSPTAMSDGVTFTVEWSDTLANGSWSNASVTEQIFTDNGTVQSVKATLPAGPDRRFLRLKIVR